MPQQVPHHFCVWVVISCVLLLLASAIGDTQTSWGGDHGKDKNGSSQTGEAPEATYESLRDIFDNENVIYRHRATMNHSGPPGIASEKAASPTIMGPLSFASQPTVNSTIFSQITTSSIEIPSSPGVTDVTKSTQDTSRETVTSAPVVSTTIRNYYCLSPSIPSDVMILPTDDQNWAVNSAHKITCLTNPASGFTSNDISLSLGYHGEPITHQDPSSWCDLVEDVSGTRFDFPSPGCFAVNLLTSEGTQQPVQEGWSRRQVVTLGMSCTIPKIRPTKVFDKYTITAMVNITEPGNYKLFCATELSPPKICTRSISVGYPPLDVTDLECKSWNWNVLECNWRIPDNPTQEPADNYQVHLVSSIGRSECRCDGGVGRCGTRSEGCMKTCCSWKKPYYPSPERYLTINFTAANQLGSASFPHKIDNWNSVVPDEAQNIVVTTADGSLEVRVQWAMPVYIGVLAPCYGVYHAVEYQLDPTIYGAAPWELGSVDVCSVKECSASFLLEHPGATYQIRVRLRVNKTNFTLEDDGWWSKATPVQCDVPPQRPWNPPRSSAGAFQVWNGNGLRDISVSWRPLPLQQHNGPNFTYVVDASANGKPLPHSEITNTFVLYRNVSKHSHVRVNVKSSNALGVSNTSASVAILPTALMPAGPVLQVVVYHFDVRQYELTWYEPRRLNNNYTIYVCTDSQDSKDQCKGDLYWMDAGNKTSINVTLEDFGLEHVDNKDLRFAVSSETHDGKSSSGMSWDGCYHPQVYRQTTMPPTLSKFISVSSTSANVSWTLDCENRAGVVEGIETEWCWGNHNSSSCNVTETMNRTDVVSGLVSLNNLEPDTEYVIRLRLQYRERLSGWSRNMTFMTSKTIRPAMATWLIATVASGCIMVAVSIVGCFSFSKMKIKEFLRLYEKPINIPAGITSDVIPKSPDQKPPLTEKSSTLVVVDTSPEKQSGESKHQGEIETLIKKSGNPENELTGPLPQHLGMAPVPQNPSGYIQAFSPDTMLNYVSIKGDLLSPRRVAEEEANPAKNGYILHNYNGGVGHPAEGAPTNETKAQMLELSEFSLPSSGYFSVLHHPGNINEHGYVESANIPEILSCANVEPLVTKEKGLMKAVTADKSFSGYPNSNIPCKGKGYVQLDFTLANVLQQSSQDSGLGDEPQAYSTSDELLTHADHTLVEELQGQGTSENYIKPLSKDNVIRNGKGYVENPFLQDDTGGYYRDPKPENSGIEMLPSGVEAYVDRQDCFQYGLPIHEDSSVEDVKTTKEETVRSDAGIIGKPSLKFTKEGYVKTEISYENGITLMVNKDILGAQPDTFAVEMRNAISYVMMPESAAEVHGKTTPQADGSYVPGDFLCKAVDLGEASNLLSGYGDGLKRREKSSFCHEKGNADPITYSHEASRGDPPVGYCRIGDGEW